ncbi:MULTISPECIES: DUF4148 domain-containing protein [Burkholderia]|jgi:hypothetical protein|uniref:DUF4148 domain-containing protein n=5 Tax=Burkholderia multivorans TaxID=87883 RepID=A0A1W0YLJ6_9BURK|nr:MULTISPECIES: DUF4148 domain-containing protein [Burkholderia]ABX17277.1 conserved hypothetical protein [Burkholderia multivorans ATCC 17616]AIO72673.1 hypothetical protein DM80_4978 [Burkholderia multivorans]AJY16358.1 hypothetical protein NP80_4947 [Burkholderia multivorans ATCC BAA-247]AOK65577.1 purine-nucleoside phosphorylase [Burkholderia multivorans]AVR18627.1 DUF4148 domain-containing protein [Burkholderia multivorans]
MKSLVIAVAAAAALSASFSTFAQSTVTRAQVRNELVQLEKAGYKPGLASPYYPNDIQAAEARVHGADASGYGAQPAPVVHSGAPAAATSNARDSIFFGQ